MPFNILVRAGTLFSVPYYLVPIVLFILRKRYNAISVPGYWLSLMQAIASTLSGLMVIGWFFIFNAPIPCLLFISIRTLGLGMWFLCIALKGMRLLYLFRFSESKAAWRRSIMNGTHSGIIPSSASSLSGGSNSGSGGVSNSRSVYNGSIAPASFVGSGDPRKHIYPPSSTYPPSKAKDGGSDMVAIDLASGRLHLPANHQQQNPNTFDTSSNGAASYSSWWFENRENVADHRLARIVVVVGGVLMAYCIALAFVPEVGLMPKVVYAPFGPGGENFGNVTNIGGGGVVRSGGFQETCSQFSWPFYPLIGIEIIFTIFVFPVILYLLRNVRDNHGIRVDIFIGIIFSFVAITVHLALTFSQKFSAIANNYFIMNLVVYITFLTSVIIPVHKSFLEQRSRKQNLEMGLSLASFKKILDDPALVKEFKQFCIRGKRRFYPKSTLPFRFFLTSQIHKILPEDFSVENIMFYEEVRHLKAKVHSSSSSQWATASQVQPELQQDPQIRSTFSAKHSFLHRKLFSGALSSPNPGNEFEMRGSLDTRRSEPTASAPRSSTDTIDFNDLHPASPGSLPPSLRVHPGTPGPRRNGAEDPLTPTSEVTLSHDHAEDDDETRTQSMDDKRPVPPNLQSSYYLVHRTFIVPDSAPLELNIPADVRAEVCLAFETGVVTVDVFDRAVEFCVDNMFWNSFARFYAGVAGSGGAAGGGGAGGVGVRRRRVLG
ncbi:hypothetical protein HDU67_006964 [Dinochytrium kinnereticum]|nr:hypothetical protein HDU67_006964 [Dinochytrium kinnereticum]